MGSLITKGINKLSDLRRSARSDMRAVFRHYREGLRFRRGAASWNEERRREWILRSLRDHIRYAAGTTPYYRDLFSRVGFDPYCDFDFEDFSKLPVLNRDTVATAGETLNSSQISPMERVKDSTGGSTGSPIHIWKGPAELGWLESGIDYAFERIGVRRDSRKAFFWGHNLDPVASDSISAQLRGYLLNERYFDCFRLSPAVFAAYHEKFERYSPDCIVAYASALGHFAEYLEEQGISPRRYPRKCFVTGAEKLIPQHRDAIERVFGPHRPVHERYGGRDFGPLGMQFEPVLTRDMEVDWAWALVEPETNDPMSPILVTKLHADAMPMIRYRVGDVAVWPTGSRSGHPAFGIVEVTGRDVDRIWLKDGGWVHGNELPHMLKDYPVKEFSLVQAEDYRVELKLVPKTGFGDDDAANIKQILTSNLHDLTVDILVVENVERTKANKWRPVTTKVKR